MYMYYVYCILSTCVSLLIPSFFTSAVCLSAFFRPASFYLPIIFVSILYHHGDQYNGMYELLIHVNVNVLLLLIIYFTIWIIVHTLYFHLTIFPFITKNIYMQR